ncbi:multiple C2 domain and transmembrane region protein 6-like [Coffea arabica]|uniref:Multiple C2 domain and transmembrane region protein 6-like n=1 Tax=Coffea arabica TaxID=13443 RepID=A0A6P6UL81_COFAR|nr:FT-interacting protein 7-like [Coffea arabica]
MLQYYLRNMQVPVQRPDYGLVETVPPVAEGGTYDVVETMQFLYVNVVKAKDLPGAEISGSLDPYVEVKVGTDKGIVTKNVEKNQSPVWESVIAFSKERLQSNLIEVTVRDKETDLEGNFVGRVSFDVTKVPLRCPPESPIAPQWYKLEDEDSQRIKTGEIMLAVWMGTQADEAFTEAWHSDAQSFNRQSQVDTRSKVYFSPNLYHLRIHVIEAKDLISSEKGRQPAAYVKVDVENESDKTEPSKERTNSPVWNSEMMFVVSDLSDGCIFIAVEDKVGPGKEEVIGTLLIPVIEVPHRGENNKLPDSRWFNLQNRSVTEGEGKKKKVKVNCCSRICLSICIDAGYHVVDEPIEFSSDFQPSAEHLRRSSIGFLELGILSAQNLLPVKMNNDGISTRTDAYCVAKYGNKWVKTRTILDTPTPHWNEKYTWEVYDPCTVITIGVFDNCQISGCKGNVKDQRIGRVRIRLSTLVMGKIYAYRYPLLVVGPRGFRKQGELHLAIRFTCTAWRNMVTQYCRPLLPKMHFLEPITAGQLDKMQYQAEKIVAEGLDGEEPPLRKETVQYVLDHWGWPRSLRKIKANFHRITSLLSWISAISQCFHDICHWKNSLTTIVVHVLFFMQVRYPLLIMPNIFLCFAVIGLRNYRFRPRHPPHLDAQLSLAEAVDEDEWDEEFDTFPTSRRADVVKMRYTRLRSVAGLIQTAMEDVAMQGERALSLVSWKDPRATAVFIMFVFFCSLVFYVAPMQVVQLTGLYLLRHPLFRSKVPSQAVNFFNRSPTKSDVLL